MTARASHLAFLAVAARSWAVLLGMAASLAPLLSDASELPVAASPESQGVRSEVLSQLSQYVRQQGSDIRAMLLVRHGSVVFEWYSAGVTRQHNHYIFSVTKSVVATLTGIAIDQKKLSGTDVSLESFLPDSAALRADPRKAHITLADLLTMRSGLPPARSNKPTGAEKDLFQEIHRSPDRVRYILDLALLDEPGKKFRYGNADPQLVVSILERATGQRALPWAERTLFRPLGFGNYQWSYPDKTGTVSGGYGLRLRAMDMAKLGQLYLQDGRWDGRQVVSRDWITAATADQTGTGYGYYWWTRIPLGTFDSYAAKGVWGQRIQVVPALDLVFVTAANLPANQVGPFFSAAVDRFVLQAVNPDGPLPEQPDHVAALGTELATAAEYLPPGRAGLDTSRLPGAPADSTDRGPRELR